MRCLFLLVCCFVFTCGKNTECEENEEWQTCGQEKRCDEENINNCLSGCLCKSGFERSTTGKCVQKCRCGINEQEIPGRVNCVRTCAALIGSCVYPLIFDPSVYTCQCKKGFGLEDGRCKKCE